MRRASSIVLAAALGVTTTAAALLLRPVEEPSAAGDVMPPVPATTSAAPASPAVRPSPRVSPAPPDLVVSPRPRLLHEGTGMYPRVVRLENSGPHNGTLIASTVSFVPRGDKLAGIGVIMASTDGGVTFTRVGTVADPLAVGRGLCCATLFEVPTRLAGLPPGTLLWAGSVGADADDDRGMAIRVWKSHDRGRSWEYLSNCAVSRGKGLWEPEFSVDLKGRLVCHFSDETHSPRHSQVLARVHSTDGGRTWSRRVITVAGRDPRSRPGMAIVRRLPDGTYLMSYELCALGAKSCGAFVRISADGWDWGEPSEFGTRATTSDGRYFRRAPTIAWTPQGGPLGSVLLIGQRLYKDRKPTKESGQVIFVNERGGKGPWRLTGAPVPVDIPGDDHCPNYSTPLLASRDGRRLLQIATDEVDGRCQAFYRVAPLDLDDPPRRKRKP